MNPMAWYFACLASVFLGIVIGGFDAREHLKGGEKFMKSLGIVRKVDDLGRVVIPMEIRRQNNWENNQALEIFADNEGGIYLKPYQRDEERKKLLEQLNAVKMAHPIGGIGEVVSAAIEFIKSKA